MRKLLLFILLYLCSCHSALAAASMEISSISDLSLGAWSIGNPGITATMDMCIFAGSNSPAGGYAITVTGNNNQYVLTSGTQQIPYSLYWNGAGAGNLSNGGTQLSSGVKLTSQLNANTNALNPLCVATGPTARLTLTITQASMTTALAGTYNGTITLLLGPN